MKKILLIGIVIIGFFSISYGYNIDINKIDVYKKVFSKSKEINNKKNKTYLWDKFIFGKTCDTKDLGTKIAIKINCFLDIKKIPQLSIQDNIDIIMPYLEGFENIYDLNSTNFIYSSGNPKWSKKLKGVDEIFSAKDEILIKVLSLFQPYLIVDKSSLAYTSVKDYSFYVSDKDLSRRNGCKKVNYNIGMSVLDKRLIKSGETYTINSDLAKYQKSYCKDHESGFFRFYGGVCGSTTQLFRNALINPYLSVERRYAHSQRNAVYYDEYIYGDDAAVYEYAKKLTIKNIGLESIYLRVYEKNNHKYLVSVYPKETNLISFVTKIQVNNLKAYVGKTIFDKKKLWIWYNQYWKSSYIKKNRDTL